jgi:WD40 repeat protein
MTIQAMPSAALRVTQRGPNSSKPAARLAFLGQQAVLGHEDGSLWFEGRAVRAHTGPLVVLQPFGDQILTAGRDGFAALWDAAGRPLFIRQHPTGPLCAATYTDGTVVLADDKGYVFAWDLHTRQTDFIGDVQAPVTALAGQDGVVMMGMPDGTVHWDGQSESRHKGAVLQLFPVGNREFLSIGADGRIRLGPDLLLRIAGEVGCSALYGNMLVIAIGRELQQWDLRNLSLVRRTTATAGDIADVALGPMGAWVLIEGERSPRHWA